MVFKKFDCGSVNSNLRESVRTSKKDLYEVLVGSPSRQFSTCPCRTILKIKKSKSLVILVDPVNNSYREPPEVGVSKTKVLIRHLKSSDVKLFNESVKPIPSRSLLRSSL